MFSPHQLDYKNFIEGQQLVNHIQNLEKLVHKDTMVFQFRKIDKLNIFPKLKSKDFTPQYFVLSYDNDYEKFMNDSISGMYIVKPVNLWGG